MKCYIYKIVNQVTKEKYVGQTTNFSRRKQNHLSALRNNRHPNLKLQNAWNKYGEDNFYWKSKSYDLTQEELDQLEIETISEENSYINGYNLTMGGMGGNARLKRKITFEQFCFIYAGNSKYAGMTGKTAKFIGCDSSVISAIKRDASYDDYRELYNNLSLDEKNKYLSDFIKEFNLDKMKPPKQEKRLSDEQVVDFLCLISCYGKGAEIAFLRAVNHAKGLGHELKTNKNYFVESKKQYNSLDEKEILKRAERVYEEYKIKQYLTYKLAKKKTVIHIDCAL